MASVPSRRPRSLGITVPTYLMIILAFVVWYVLERTPVGRRMYAAGYNPDGARLAGVNVARLKIGALIAGGVIAAIAGVLLTSRLNTGEPTVGPGLLLPALTAVFLGSTQFKGGRFNVWGTVLAVYVLAVGHQGPPAHRRRHLDQRPLQRDRTPRRRRTLTVGEDLQPAPPPSAGSSPANNPFVAIRKKEQEDDHHDDVPQSLEQKIQAAGGPVPLLRGPGQLGPYVFPGIAAEFTNWRDEVRSWKDGAALSWSSRTI